MIPTLGGDGGAERTDFCTFSLQDSVLVFRRLIFLPFLLWESVMSLRGLIFNNFYWGVVLKGLVLDHFYFGMVWWS